ncbi:MAG: 4Fe-4S dicluster domain-containing protein [Prevotellaceae bacterium]|jgi:heterodisulfide reductase subunit C|nr:4Fe-4S dicluster domain-containing protein [Prevotellaceae bacterium]
MDNVKKRAAELLKSEAVKVVIGYTMGTNGKPRAAFIQNAEDVDSLIFNAQCVQNLAVYLSKAEIKQLGKPAIVAPLNVLRAIIQLASEMQIQENELIVLGVSPDGELIDFQNFSAIEKYLEDFNMEVDAKEKETLEKISSMSLEERWKFWNEELAECFKCYACRAACPMCYCHKCAVEQNKPQWIPVAAHRLGNLEWHIMRAMHLAGRCVNCDACHEACPKGINLNFLTKLMLNDAQEEFGYTGVTLKEGNLLSTFKTNDQENFIQ